MIPIKRNGFFLEKLEGAEFPNSSNKSNQAGAYVSAERLWINGQTACDVSVFNPLARYHLNYSLEAVHKRNENKKKREISSESFK